MARISYSLIMGMEATPDHVKVEMILEQKNLGKFEFFRVNSRKIQIFANFAG
jgi:hypothetical protein